MPLEPDDELDEEVLEELDEELLVLLEELDELDDELELEELEPLSHTAPVTVGISALEPALLP